LNGNSQKKKRPPRKPEQVCDWLGREEHQQQFGSHVARGKRDKRTSWGGGENGGGGGGKKLQRLRKWGVRFQNRGKRKKRGKIP